MSDHLDRHYLEDNDFDQIESVSFPSSQPWNTLLDGSQDGDHLEDDIEEDNMSEDD